MKILGVVLFCAVFIGGCCGILGWFFSGGEDLLCKNVDKEAQIALENLIEWEFPEDMKIDKCTESYIFQGYSFYIYATYPHEKFRAYLEQQPLPECTVVYRNRFGTEYVVISAGESIRNKEEYDVFLQVVGATNGH